MITQVLGGLVILSILFMAFYCIKGYNMTVGFFLMSAIWIAISFAGNMIEPNSAMEGLTAVEVLTDVFQAGPEAYGRNVLVNVLFGAFFGTVLIETGIASTLIRKTVELGGDHPRVTVNLLCLVTAVLFTSLTGVGPYIAIGVVVLPIMLALGISPLVSVFAFIGSAGVSASFLNVVNFQQYQTIFETTSPEFANYSYNDYFPFAIVAATISLIVILTIVNVKIGKAKKVYSWDAGQSIAKSAPALSLISVAMPVILLIAFNLPVILSFILSSLFALITTGHLKGGFVEASRKIAKYGSDGAISVAPMMAFLLAIATYNAAAAYVAPYLGALLSPVIPATTLGLAIVFGVFGVLGHFRGPMNLVGSGLALLHVVAAVTSWPIQFLYPLFIVTTIIPQGLDITLSGAVWALDYAKVQSKDYMRLGIPTSATLCVIMAIVVYLMYGSLM